MGARYYSPSLGQFISPDPLPIVTGQGDLNVYAYVRGRSYRAVDPTGLFGEDSAQLGSAGGAGAVPDTLQMRHADIEKSKSTKKATTVEPYWQSEGNGARHSYAYSIGGPEPNARHMAQAAGNGAIRHVLSASPLIGIPSVVNLAGAALGYENAAGSIADRVAPIDASANAASRSLGGFIPTVASVAVLGVAAGVEAELSRGAAAGAELALGEAGSMVHAGGQMLRHYTNEAGFQGIMEAGMIRPNAAGQVFATEMRGTPQAVEEVLFGNFPTHAGRGSHVIEFTPEQGVSFVHGKNVNEVFHLGTIRFGRQVQVNYAGVNPYGG